MENNKIFEEEDIYAEIGVNSPCLLAEHHGIKLMYLPNTGDICGMYMVSGSETYTIFLNSAVDTEKLDKVVHLLIKHHYLSPGQTYAITRKEMTKLYKIEKHIRKISGIISAAFMASKETAATEK